MIYDYQKDRTLPKGCTYDADTGERLKYVFRFDDETGDYWYYATDSKGNFQMDPTTGLIVELQGKRRRIKFVPYDENGNADFVPDDISNTTSTSAERKINFREFL